MDRDLGASLVQACPKIGNSNSTGVNRFPTTRTLPVCALIDSLPYPDQTQLLMSAQKFKIFIQRLRHKLESQPLHKVERTTKSHGFLYFFSFNLPFVFGRKKKLQLLELEHHTSSINTVYLCHQVKFIYMLKQFNSYI